MKDQESDKKKKRKTPYDDSSKTKKGKGNQGKEKVYNQEQDNQAKLAEGLNFGEVFCKEVCKGVTQPKMDDGTEMCNRF